MNYFVERNFSNRITMKKFLVYHMYVEFVTIQAVYLFNIIVFSSCKFRTTISESLLKVLVLSYAVSTLVGLFLQFSLQVSLSAHSCISSTFLSSSHVSTHRVCGLPMLPLPLTFIFNNLYGVLCSSILSKCRNHFNLLFSILIPYFLHVELSPNVCAFNSVSPSSSHCSPGDFISAACSLLSFHLVHFLVSAQCNNILSKNTRYVL
jgi:hypothetical protein